MHEGLKRIDLGRDQSDQLDNAFIGDLCFIQSANSRVLVFIVLRTNVDHHSIFLKF
jgi:hypothetical protein